MVFRGPIRNIPESLVTGYTMNGAIPIQDYFLDGTSVGREIRWRDEDYQQLLQSTRECIDGEAEKKWVRYPSDTYLVRLLKRHSIQGQSVLIIGSEIPWYEAMVAQFGGRPTTVEYRPINHDIEGLQTFTVEEFEASDIQFDCAVSISSIEHSGLGRYGDPLDPDADFKAMDLYRRHVKPGGLMFFHVPIGRDVVAWNAHRIYGEIRLPRLLDGWQTLDSEGYHSAMLTHGEVGSAYDSVFLLRNGDIESKMEEPGAPGMARYGSMKPPLINVALHKAATQSSDSGDRCHLKPAGANATSGMKSGGFGFHTRNEPEPWWQLDLQQVRDIRRVVVYNRENAEPDRANTMSIALGVEPAGPWREIHRCKGRFGGFLSGAPLVVSLDQSLPARYVRLQLNDTKAFHLDEVEVYAEVDTDDPNAARIEELYARQAQTPEAERMADSRVVNGDAWNCIAFRDKHHIDLTSLRGTWYGAKPQFEIDAGQPFDGEIEALRVRPAGGGFGNIFYDILNACLLARAMKCKRLEIPTVEGEPDALPVEVDGIRIARTRTPDTILPTLAASFYWPNGFERLLGNYSTDFLLDTINRFIRPVFGKALSAAGPSGVHGPGDHILTMHFRGGDIFWNGFIHPWYVQPPASFYVKAVKFAMTGLGVTAARLVYQDRTNPCVDIVSDYLTRQGIPFTLQSASVFDDVVTLMSARHLVAPYGTFCESIGLLSERLMTYIGFRTLSTQQEISWWSQSRVAEVLEAKGVRTLVIDDADRSYISPKAWANSPEQIDLMRTFPETKLWLLERR